MERLDHKIANMRDYVEYIAANEQLVNEKNRNISSLKMYAAACSVPMIGLAIAYFITSSNPLIIIALLLLGITVTLLIDIMHEMFDIMTAKRNMKIAEG